MADSTPLPEPDLAQMQQDIAYLKQQLSTHAKNTDDALSRMADANKACADAVAGNQANAQTIAGQETRIAALEKKGA